MAIKNVPFTLFQEKGVETKPRALRFDLNAMADFEEKTGMGLAQLMSTNAVYATTRAMLWAGLKHAERGLTVDRVGALMQEYVQAGGDVQDLLQACFEAALEQRAIPGLKKTDGEGASQDGTDPNAQ